jgi:hypothetical protein
VRESECPLHATNALFCFKRRKVAGAPGTGVVMGEGVGGQFVRQPEKAIYFQTGDCAERAEPVGNEPSELLN